MSSKAFVAVFMLSSLIILLVGTEFIDTAWGNFHPPPPELPPIYIRENGNVEPSNASIQLTGDSYVFTDNLTGYCIWVQKSNIVIDGNGHRLQGLSNRTSNIMYGMVLEGMTNVTVKNITFEGLNIGVNIVNPSGNSPSSNNQITENVFRDCYYGVYLGYQAFNNTLLRNTFTDMEPYCIYLASSYSNTILENSILDNRVPTDSIFASTPEVHGLGCGTIALDTSSNNTIARNNFENNTRTVELLGNSYGNLFCLNNFIDSSVMLMLPYPPPFNSNLWDNGSEGNYWSNYNGSDTDLNGIGDTPYAIDGNNTDYHPLMSPAIISFTLPSPSPTVTSISTKQPTSSPSIPEFPTWIILPLAMISVLLAVLASKSKRNC